MTSLWSKPIYLQAGRPFEIDTGLFPNSSEIPSLFISFMQYKRVAKPHDAWLLSRTSNFSTTDAYATLNRGRLNRDMRVTLNSNEVAKDKEFMISISEFASQKRAGVLAVEIASPTKTDLSKFCDGIGHKSAQLFIIDMNKTSTLSNNHKRNLKKAKKNNVRIACNTGSDSMSLHVNLCEHSRERRKNRGESVLSSTKLDSVKNYIDNCGARLYQAVLNNDVVSSDLIFFIGKFAFYDSGGSNSDGMSVGASYLLMSSIIDELREDSVRALNLGVGTVNRPGLSRFKEGFGADRYEYETLKLDTSTRVQWALRKISGVLSKN